MTIKRVDVLSVAKIAAVVYAGLGLLVGLIFACIALLGAGFTAAMQNDGQLPPIFSVMFGVGAVIAAPILYSILGFLLGALVSWLFNLAAGITGGVKFQVDS